MKKRTVKTSHNKLFAKYLIITFIIILISCSSKNMEYSNEIEYSNELQDENFAPELIKDNNYRNIALHRPAYHSSSYNYNLTAQLVNDGIIDNIPPLWIRILNSQTGLVTKPERNFLFDQNNITGYNFKNSKGWIKFESNHFAAFNNVDSISIQGRMYIDLTKSENWEISLSTSPMGIHYEPVKTITGNKLPEPPAMEKQDENAVENFRIFDIGASLGKSMRSCFYKLDFQCDATMSWEIDEMSFFFKGIKNEVGGPYIFTSAWKSEGNNNEWVSIDLGKKCKFNKVLIHWLDPAKEARLETSNDGNTWDTFKTISGNTSTLSELKFRKNIKGRYIRINMLEPLNGSGYAINEIEVFGRGGLTPQPQVGPTLMPDEKLMISGGNWKTQRSSLVKSNAKQISGTEYDDSGWIIATVPATLRMSYFYSGLIPDPQDTETEEMISESFFYSDFWFRNEFVIPKSFTGKNIFLHFEGIYPKADIFVNGEKFGTIEEPINFATYNVSQAVYPGELNTIAVKLFKEELPRSPEEFNRSKPTTENDQGIGIWGNVYISCND